MNAPVRNTILLGDAHDRLAELPAESVDMVLTSPPYFRLRDYQIEGQLGMESHVEQWVTGLRAVVQQMHRVLLPTGSLWLNLGDSFSLRLSQGADQRSLLLGPERLALALIADGWLLRNKIVWHKPNPMPSSAHNRLTCTWEILYTFTKQANYFFDLDTIRTPHTSQSRPRRRPANYRRPPKREDWRGPNAGGASGIAEYKARGIIGHPLGKNPGDVWRIATSTYRGAHHATFPPPLAERAIQAGSPEARCTRCHAPWTRPLHRSGTTASRGQLQPSCSCDASSEPAIVLDPFFGAGTTAIAAERLGRDWLGVELNPAFADLANRRIQQARAGPTKDSN